MKNTARPLTLLILFTVLTPCIAAESWTVIDCPAIDRNIENHFEQVEALTDFQAGLGSINAISGSQQVKATATLDTKTLAQPTARVGVH